MSVEMRILTCRLLEKMKLLETYGERLGLEDASKMHGLWIEQVKQEVEKKGCG